jgi:hypothetical protein
MVIICIDSEELKNAGAEFRRPNQEKNLHRNLRVFLLTPDCRGRQVETGASDLQASGDKRPMVDRQTDGFALTISEMGNSLVQLSRHHVSRAKTVNKQMVEDYFSIEPQPAAGVIPMPKPEAAPEPTAAVAAVR